MSKSLTSAQPYTPTKHTVTRWFNIINKEIFDDGLEPFDNIEIKPLRGVWGYCVTYTDLGDDDCDLEIRCRFPNFQMFLNCLAHEMVHLFNHQILGEQNLRHGPKFFAWRDDFTNHGLTLTRKL